MKRLMDLFIALMAGLLFAPVMLIVAVAIKLDSKGPVFYRQERVGLNGSHFNILKFRSMVTNADKIGGFSTADNDSRITRCGRFIRRSSLDELPQLINVIVGDMSIVGPRPDVPEQRVLYSDMEWQLRHSVKPGITGLAQSTLRSQATPAQRKMLDLEYAKSHSFMQDCKIILNTAHQVLFKGGN